EKLRFGLRTPTARKQWERWRLRILCWTRLNWHLGTRRNTVTLNEARQRGISRVRDPKWAHPNDYLKIQIIPNEDGTSRHGPWIKLYSPLNTVVGIPTPQTLLFTSVDWNED